MGNESRIISEGTLRPEDLIPRFVDALDERLEEMSLEPGAGAPERVRYQDEAHVILGGIERRAERPDYFGSDDAEQDLEWLQAALQECAPEGFTFGANEGDGACYGYWPDEEEQDAREWNGEDYYGLRVFEREGKRYAFAQDADEARAAAGRYIEDSLWAFRPGFLLSFIEHEEHARGRVERALARLQEDLCEDANDLVRVLVGARLDALKAAAIAADGLGHFLAPYDGRENEEPDGGLSFRLD